MRYACLIHCPVSRTHFQSFFSHSSTAPVGQGLFVIEDSRSHSDTQLSVGHLWTRDRSAVQTSTWQHTLNKGQTSIPPTGFEPAISASKRPYTHVLDHEANGIDHYQWIPRKKRTNSGYTVTFGSNVVPVFRNYDFRGNPEIYHGHLSIPIHAQHSLSISRPHSAVYNVCGVIEHNNRDHVNVGTFIKKKSRYFFLCYTLLTFRRLTSTIVDVPHR